MLKEFLNRAKKPLIVLVSLLVVVFASMAVADGIQKDWGRVEVTSGVLEVNNVKENCDLAYNYQGENDVVVAYKLYKPKIATKDNKVPAALLLHGYQNDHETCGAYAIELSRRGMVVLAIDEYGHGSTETGMLKRGYTDHKVTVNYGTDEDGVSYVKASGADRYKLMMNFSNLSFFQDRYSNSQFGDTASVYDSSMGGIAAYYFLSRLDYVDNKNMAVSGHSMGTWASWTVSAAYSGTSIMPRATILQCGELFDMTGKAYDTSKIQFNNVMLLQAKWDEFNYFRDYQNTVTDELLKTELRYNFLGVTPEEAKWNTTFGDFADGSGRRIELLYTNHRLTTHDFNGLKASFDWLKGAVGLKTEIANTNQVAMLKECLVLVATLAALASTMALMMVLKEVKFFATVNNSFRVSDDKVKTGWKFWSAALLTMLFAGIFYPFATQLGHGLFPLPEGVFRMTIGNGFLIYYLMLVVVMAIFIIVNVVKNKKKGTPVSWADLGYAREEHKDKFDWVYLGKSALIVLCMCAWFYIQLAVCQALFQLDFRFIWPFWKGFTLTRLGQFFVYLPMYLLFYCLSIPKIIVQNQTKDTFAPGFKGFMKVWWKYMLCMTGGLFFIILLEYIPFFAGIGPGADLLFSSTFGGPFMSLLIVLAPQVILYSILATYSYRKTGNAWIGAILVAVLACWVVTGGSAMF